MKCVVPAVDNRCIGSLKVFLWQQNPSAPTVGSRRIGCWRWLCRKLNCSESAVGNAVCQLLEIDVSFTSARCVVHLSALHRPSQRVALAIAAPCVYGKNFLLLSSSSSLGVSSLCLLLFVNTLLGCIRFVLISSPIQFQTMRALFSCSRQYALGLYWSCSHVLANTVFENVHLAPYPHQHAIG